MYSYIVDFGDSMDEHALESEWGALMALGRPRWEAEDNCPGAAEACMLGVLQEFTTGSFKHRDQ
jgi:hypothetical protein